MGECSSPPEPLQPLVEHDGDGGVFGDNDEAGVVLRVADLGGGEARDGVVVQVG